MKLYIKQKLISFVDRFSVKDETKTDVFYVEGRAFSFGKQLSIQTMDFKEVAFVRQKVFNFLPTFEIKLNQETHLLKKQFTFFTPIYTVPSLRIRVEGNFIGHHYTILRDDIVIAKISKAILSFVDHYEVEIISDNDIEIILAIVMAIDAALSIKRSNQVKFNNKR